MVNLIYKKRQLSLIKMVKEADAVLKVGKELADYIIGIKYTDLSPDVTHQAKRVILDSLGTMYMGTRKPEANKHRTTFCLV